MSFNSIIQKIKNNTKYELATHTKSRDTHHPTCLRWAWPDHTSAQLRYTRCERHQHTRPDYPPPLGLGRVNSPV